MPAAAATYLTDAEPAPRVILVDDDPMGLLLTARALRERGFEVLDFDRPGEALAAVAAGGVDCVIADVLMPGMDGFEFCRRVRSTRDGEHLPLLMLTSLDEDEATRRAYEAGASDYCIKSVNWTLLVHRIRQLMHLGRLERDSGRGRAVAAAGTATPQIGAFDWQPAARRLRGSTDLFGLLDWRDPPASLHDRHLLALASPSDRRGLRRAMAQMLDGGPAVRREIEVRTRGGRVRRVRIDVHQVVSTVSGALEVTGAVHDVTPVEVADGTVYRLTHCDGLTGLPNRTWLLERLQRPRGAAAVGRLGLAVLDIDRFRQVGEALGQEATDRLLSELAQRLRRLSGASTAARGRDGWVEAVVNLRGDAFALLLDGLADADAGLAIGRRAVEALHEPFRIAGRELFLRASVGVHVGDGDEAAAQRIGRAELARRAASAAGGNAAAAFHPSMQAPGFDRLEMERDLHYALARREMSMHFQPQVDATDGRVIGFEALMRWVRGGTTQPAGTFIPLAEETGLIVPLGEWAIGESCEALAALRRRGHLACTMSVNLSAQQLRTGRLPGVLSDALRASGVPAEQFEVELTESGMMRDAEVAVAELTELRAIGAGLAVDDFGTGYSSLAYLTRLPLTTLKIDRSFVQDVDTSDRSRAVALAIVALGANLHLRVVAEGVETDAQRRTLIELGCTLQQGWLYGRAAPLDEALAFADAHRDPHRLVAVGGAA